MEREVMHGIITVKKRRRKYFEFAEEYRKFISACKTERECVHTFVEAKAEAAGYLDIKKVIAEGIKLESGARVYADNNGKALAMFIVERNQWKRACILGAHVDSPRMDLKQNPFYEDTGLGYVRYPLLWWCEEIPVGNTSAGIAWCSGEEKRRKCSRGKYWR